MMKLAKYKAVLCEGAAEEAIFNILLDNHLLLFEREELIEEKVLRCRDAKKFERMYLRKTYEDKITILRILDSRNERFNLSKEYRDKVDVVNVVTAPEIEMLIIHAEDEYEEFKKSRKKPSAFCKENLKMKKVKDASFLQKYFSDPEKLLRAIITHDKKCGKNKEYNLSDLLTDRIYSKQGLV